MTKKSELGQFGEDFAAEYLQKQGYKIIDRNFRQPWGEIDIIAKDPDNTLVFVEVKTLQQFGNPQNPLVVSPAETQLMPEDQLTSAKLQKLKKTASGYASANPKLIKENRGWRIDLVALALQNSSFETRHYKNICA